MSIYGSTLGFDDWDHADGCAYYVEDPPGSQSFEFSGKSCDCGTPTAPIIYQGSHVLPSDDDPRGGALDFAEIPSHIERDDRPELPDGTNKDWLRVSLDAHQDTYGQRDTIVLDRNQVEKMRDYLTDWLDREPLPPYESPYEKGYQDGLAAAKKEEQK